MPPRTAPGRACRSARGSCWSRAADPSASRQRPVRTSSFQSGIRLPSGQPEWQNGTPQSMQRPACDAGQAGVGTAAPGRGGRRSRASTGRYPAVRRRDRQEAARVSHRPPPPRAARPARAPAAGRAAAPSGSGPGRPRPAPAAAPPAGLPVRSRCRSSSSSDGRLVGRLGDRLDARRCRGCSGSGRRRPARSATPPDMPAAKLRPVGAEHEHHAAGHVLAAVVADALDHRGGAASCARRSARRREPRKNASPGGGAVQRGVAGERLRRLGRRGGRAHHQRPPDRPLPA